MRSAIRFATVEDVPVIFQFIKELAEYERLSHAVTASEDMLRAALFGDKQYAEVIIGMVNDTPVGFALFFNNFSTFLAKPGIYLEDLYITPEARGHGLGKKMLSFLAKLVQDRDCGRLEWSVLDWNEPSIVFYKKMGAKPMDEWTVFRVEGDELDQLANESR